MASLVTTRSQAKEKAAAFSSLFKNVPCAPDAINGLADYFRRYGNDKPIPDKPLKDTALAKTFIREVFKGHDNIVEPLKDALDDSRLFKNFRRVDDLLDLWDNHFMTPEPKPVTWTEGSRAARRMLRKILDGRNTRKNLRSVPLTKGNMPRLITNKMGSMGSTGYGHLKGECEDLLFKSAKYLLESRSLKIYPAIVLTRAHLGGFWDAEKEEFTPYDEWKFRTRFITCMSGADSVIDQRFVQPFMDGVLRHVPQYAGGKSPKIIRYRLNKVKTSWVSIDYSKYDSSVPASVICQIFEIIKEFFPAKADKDDLDFIKDRFINTWVVLPDGRCEQKHKGIPSGSGFTQIVGTLANMYLILHYLNHKWNNDEAKIWNDLNCTFDRLRSDYYGEASFMAMGDDNIIFTKSKLDLEDLSWFLKTRYEITIHPKKCETSDDVAHPSFLKRMWTMGGEMREIVELLIQAIHPENKRFYKDYNVWHIIYAYWLTYEATFRKYIDVVTIKEKMKNNGGLTPLLKVPIKALPGPMQGLIISGGFDLYQSALALDKMQ